MKFFAQLSFKKARNLYCAYFLLHNLFNSVINMLSGDAVMSSDLESLTGRAVSIVDTEAFEIGKKRFTDALDNDLNTSLAVTAIYDVFKLRTNDKTKLALIEDFERVMSLGIIEAAEKIKEAERKKKEEETAGVDPELLAYINQMIEARRTAKAEKNFAEADRIRVELLEKGITLIDTREGTKFKIGE